MNDQIIICYSPLNALCSSDESVQKKHFKQHTFIGIWFIGILVVVVVVVVIIIIIIIIFIIIIVINIFDFRNSFNCKLKKLLNDQIIICYSPLNALCSSDESVQKKHFKQHTFIGIWFIGILVVVVVVVVIIIIIIIIFIIIIVIKLQD